MANFIARWAFTFALNVYNSVCIIFLICNQDDLEVGDMVDDDDSYQCLYERATSATF